MYNQTYKIKQYALNLFSLTEEVKNFASLNLKINFLLLISEIYSSSLNK